MVSGFQGYYTKPDRFPDQRAEQVICEVGHWCEGGLKYECPKGYWGGTEGLNTSECSGLCFPGYYCPVASYSPRQIECGNASVYCPQGSYEPTPVSIGYYTDGASNSTRSVCSLLHLYPFASSRHECKHAFQRRRVHLCSWVVLP
jgi:hypothetical protein